MTQLEGSTPQLAPLLRSADGNGQWLAVAVLIPAV